MPLTVKIGQFNTGQVIANSHEGLFADARSSPHHPTIGQWTHHSARRHPYQNRTTGTGRAQA